MFLVVMWSFFLGVENVMYVFFMLLCLCFYNIAWYVYVIYIEGNFINIEYGIVEDDGKLEWRIIGEVE